MILEGDDTMLLFVLSMIIPIYLLVKSFSTASLMFVSCYAVFMLMLLFGLSNSENEESNYDENYYIEDDEEQEKRNIVLNGEEYVDEDK